MIVISVPPDDQTSLGAGASAGTVMAEYETCLLILTTISLHFAPGYPADKKRALFRVMDLRCLGNKH